MDKEVFIICTICLGSRNKYFCILIFYVKKGMQLKVIVERSLLSKDEPLTSNIGKVMAFEFFEGGLKIRKIGENWTSHFWFSFSFAMLPWSAVYRS